MALEVSYTGSLSFTKKTTDDLLRGTETARVDIGGSDSSSYSLYYQDILSLTAGTPQTIDLAAEGFTTVSFIVVKGTSGSGTLTISHGTSQSFIIPANGGFVHCHINDSAATLTIDPGADDAACQLLVIGS